MVSDYVSVRRIGAAALERSVRPLVTAALSFLVTASPALAIDCRKTADLVDRRICASPNLIAADSAMNRAYLNLVRAAPDREIRDMLVNSQRRWIQARNFWLTSRGVTAGAIHEAIVDRTRKLGDHSANGFVGPAEAERKLFSKYRGGVFTGFNTRCEFIPDDPDRQHWSYICTGVVQAQNGDRICSVESDWATWRIYAYLGVSEIKDGKAIPTGSCALDDGCDPSTDIRWKHGREIGARDMFPSIAGLPKLDAEADSVLDGHEGFFDRCLIAPRQPPHQ